MSQSPEFRQELLSAYLDDALSADERIHVEQMVQNDGSVREELELLKSLQSNLKQSLELDVKLGKDFGDRVWQAVLAQAETENLADDHPVRLAAAREAAGEGVSRGSRYGAWVGGLAALAASLMLVFALTAGDNDQPSMNTLADATVVQDASTDIAEVQIGKVDEPTVTTSEPDPTSIASAPVTEPIEMTSPVKAAPEPQVVNPVAPSKNQIATTEKPLTKEERAALETEGQELLKMMADGKMLNAIMLIEIEVTERGRDLDEIGYALETAGIKKVDDITLTHGNLQRMSAAEVIGAVGTSEPTGDTKLLFARGSAKRIDQLVLSLFGRDNVVKNMGYDLVLNPQLSAVVDELKKNDGNLVRHSDTGAIARQLTLGGNVDARFPRSPRDFEALGEANFKKLRWQETMGPDFNAQALILVRSPTEE